MITDSRSVSSPVMRSIASSLDRAIERAKECLLSKQAPQGYWCAELQGDSILESEYILTRFILDQENDPDLPLIANYLRDPSSNPTAAGTCTPAGKADLSGTVKAYFALKLMGDDPEAPHMRRAREVILSLGGAEKCNTFTRVLLRCPGPDHLRRLPQHSAGSCPASANGFTSTSTTCQRLDAHHDPASGDRHHVSLHAQENAANRSAHRRTVHRLRRRQSSLADPLEGLPKDWRDMFLRIDQFLKRYEEAPHQFLRRKAFRDAEKWMLEHLDGTDGLGAIFPPMVYMLIVLRDAWATPTITRA